MHQHELQLTEAGAGTAAADDGGIHDPNEPTVRMIAMLAELFMMRVEAAARMPPERLPSSQSRLVPLVGDGFQFKKSKINPSSECADVADDENCTDRLPTAERNRR